MNSYRHSSVNREPLAAILQREVDRDGRDRVALEISASGFMSYEAASRRLWSILNPGEYVTRSGALAEQEVVDLNVADGILQALGLTYVWQTELADQVNIATCRGCGIDRDEYTRGCQPCCDRKWQRKKYQRAKAQKRALAAPPPAPRTADSPGKGTTLKEAA